MKNIGQEADALWTNHLTLRPRQTKTEKDEYKGELSINTDETVAPLQLTTNQSDEDGTLCFYSNATR